MKAFNSFKKQRKKTKIIISNDSCKCFPFYLFNLLYQEIARSVLLIFLPFCFKDFFSWFFLFENIKYKASNKIKQSPNFQIFGYFFFHLPHFLGDSNEFCFLFKINELNIIYFCLYRCYSKITLPPPSYFNSQYVLFNFQNLIKII